MSSRSKSKALSFLSSLKSPPPYLELEDLIAQSDLVVETAGGHVVPDLADKTFGAGKDLMVISIGAILEHPEVLESSRASGCRLFLPSGAIAGLDGIKSACRGSVDSVTMVSRKPPEAWAGAPFLQERGISLDGLEKEVQLYSGTAREACRGFPSNLNVSAAVSLAGIGPDRTEVCIKAVPGLERNCHDVAVEGEFGSLAIHIENIPSENPKTGRLTALSILRALEGATDTVRLGT